MPNDYKISVGDTDIDTSSVINSVSAYNVYVNVVRDTKVNSSEGYTKTPVAIITNLLCDIKWKIGGEKILFNKSTHYLDAVLHCRKPAGVTIATTDRIYYNEEYYEIVDVTDVNNLGVLLKISIRKIK